MDKENVGILDFYSAAKNGVMLLEEKLIEPGSQTQKGQASFLVLSVESRFTYIHVMKIEKNICDIKGKKTKGRQDGVE